MLDLDINMGWPKMFYSVFAEIVEANKILEVPYPHSNDQRRMRLVDAPAGRQTPLPFVADIQMQS